MPGGIQGDFERLGVEIDHAGRHAQAEELMQACRALWTGELTDFMGLHHLHGVPAPPPPAGTPRHQGGAHRVPSRWLHDSPTYTCCGLSHWSRSAHVLNGSRPGTSLRSHGHVRVADSTWSSATTRTPLWAAAESLIAHADPHVVQQRQAIMVGTPMVGQQAQARRVAQHRIGAHLWNGLSTVRVNCGTAIVGTPQEVTEEPRLLAARHR